MPTPDLNKLKAFLNISGTTYDTELPLYLTSARAAMRHKVGADTPTAVTNEVRALRGTVLLLERPVISLTSVEDDDGNTIDTTGAKLRGDAGIVRRLGGCHTGYVTVTYQAGWSVFPEDLELATYVVAGHLWETQRGHTGSFAQIHGIDDSAPQGGDASFYVLQGFAWPRRAMELIQPYTQEGFA